MENLHGIGTLCLKIGNLGDSDSFWILTLFVAYRLHCAYDKGKSRYEYEIRRNGQM